MQMSLQEKVKHYTVPNIDRIDRVIISHDFLSMFAAYGCTVTADPFMVEIPFVKAIIQVRNGDAITRTLYYEKFNGIHIIGRPMPPTGEWLFTFFDFQKDDDGVIHLSDYGMIPVEKIKGVWQEGNRVLSTTFVENSFESEDSFLREVLYFFDLIKRIRDYQSLRKPVRKQGTSAQVKRKNRSIPQVNYKAVRYNLYEFTEALKDRITREYTTPEWSVRGFYRQYKSGKKVWIQPHKAKRASELLSERAFSKQSVFTLKGR